MKFTKTLATIFAGALILVAAGTAVVSSTSFAQSAQDNSIDTSKVYKVGIEDGYYPYEYYNKQGEFVGYDVDVINLVCKKLNMKCELQKGNFDALIPNLVYKKSDLVISDLSITDERKKVVDFSDSYVPAQGALFIVNDKNKNEKPDQLKVIGVEQGTTLYKYLQTVLNKNGNYRIITYPSFDTAMLDLKAGRVDAVFESIDTSAKYRLDPKNKVTYIGKPIYSPLLSQGTGIAFRKSDTALRLKVNQVIKELEADGTLKALRAKYGISVDTLAVDAAKEK